MRAAPLCTLLLAAVLHGQSAAPKAASTLKAPPQAISSQQDKVIEQIIRAKLAKSKVGKDGFTVRVQGGVAYWDGTTSVVQHKGSATRMAKTAGAVAVVNHIKVSDAAKQKAAENLDQGRRRAQVKRSDVPDPIVGRAVLSPWRAAEVACLQVSNISRSEDELAC